MSTFAAQVSASGGDASQASAGSAGNPTAAAPTFTTSSTNYIAFRFANVTIANGATVSAADIQIYVNSSKTLSMDGTFYAEAADNSSVFTTSTNDISGRTKTSQSTVWTATLTGLAFNTSTDIAAQIQAVVQRAGWVSGNALTIIGIARSTSSCIVGMWDDTGDATDAAKLDITYTNPASGPAGLKTFNGLAKASIKTIDGLALASVKNRDGLA